MNLSPYHEEEMGFLLSFLVRYVDEKDCILNESDWIFMRSYVFLAYDALTKDQLNAFWWHMCGRSVGMPHSLEFISNMHHNFIDIVLSPKK